MNTYKGYTISKTTTTIGAELHRVSSRDRYLLKITCPQGYALRNSTGNLPIVTTIDGARALIDEEIYARASK